MIISVILLFSVRVIGAPLPFLINEFPVLGTTQPALIKNIKSLPFYKALQVAKVSKPLNLDIGSKLDKSMKEALRYHNAVLDGHEAVKYIMEIPKAYRYKYLLHLLKNPTVDLSIGDQTLVRKLVADGDLHSIILFVNNPNADLSFDDNYLLKLASAEQNKDMINLLLEDKRVRKSSSHRYAASELDDELESLGFSKYKRPRSDSEITVNSGDVALLESLDGGIENESDKVPNLQNDESQSVKEAPLIELSRLHF